LEVADGDGLIERAADFRAGEKIGFAFEGNFNVSRNGIVDQEGAKLRVVLCLRQRKLKLRGAGARLQFG
jgi:hypothetical protein